MSLRPTRRRHHAEETIHLNITPFLDILVCLILFLLSAAAFLKLAVIDSNLPKLVEASEVTPEEGLIVTLRITSAGFEIGRVGADANPSRQQRWTSGGDLAGSIPRDRDGKYNFKLLNQQMIKIKQIYPDSASVMLLPAGEIVYETLIDAMDATREVQYDKASADPQEQAKAKSRRREYLFPDAVIGHVSEQEGGA